MSLEVPPPLDDIKPMLSPPGELLCDGDVQLTEEWNESADTSMTLMKFLESSERYDRMIWGSAYLDYPERCEAGWKRFIGEKNGLHIVPKTIDCDRTFLRSRLDAAYLEAAVKYLRGVSSTPPIQAPSVWIYPLVGELERRIRSKNWAVGAAEASRYYNRLISPTDWASFSCRNIQGRFRRPSRNSESMLVKPSVFSKIPEFIHELSPPCHLGIEMARMAYYFAHTVSLCDACVKRRYSQMLELETKINVTVAFLQEVERGRVWDIRREHQLFLKVSLPSLPEIRKFGEYANAGALGDLRNVLRNMSLWEEYKTVAVKSLRLFEDGKNLMAGKSLEYCGVTLCFDKNLLYEVNLSAIELTEAVDTVNAQKTPSGTYSAYNNTNRPRMAKINQRRSGSTRASKRARK